MAENKPMSRLKCWLTGGHKLVRYCGGRNNNMRIMVAASVRCTKCAYRNVEKI